MLQPVVNIEEYLQHRKAPTSLGLFVENKAIALLNGVGF